jgi:hypothetical protein
VLDRRLTYQKNNSLRRSRQIGTIAAFLVMIATMLGTGGTTESESRLVILGPKLVESVTMSDILPLQNLGVKKNLRLFLWP